MPRSEAPETLSELRLWLASAPAGTLLQAETLHAVVSGIEDALDPEPAPAEGSSPPAPTWRTKPWTAPADTRIGRRELLEAVGRSDSWLYRHKGSKPACGRIPHRKLDGELVFVVGEIRRWLKEHEDIIEAGPTDRAGELHALR